MRGARPCRRVIPVGRKPMGRTDVPRPTRRRTMRKMAMVLAAVAALSALGAGSVLAQEGDAGPEVEGAKVATDKAGNQTIQCTGVPCTASGRSDLVFERIGQGL